MRLNWGATLIIGLGAILLIIGWQGTHDKIWRVLTAPGNTFGTSAGCASNQYIATTGPCKGKCTRDTIAGPVCV